MCFQNHSCNYKHSEVSFLPLSLFWNILEFTVEVFVRLLIFLPLIYHLSVHLPITYIIYFLLWAIWIRRIVFRLDFCTIANVVKFQHFTVLNLDIFKEFKCYWKCYSFPYSHPLLCILVETLAWIKCLTSPEIFMFTTYIWIFTYECKYS